MPQINFTLMRARSMFDVYAPFSRFFFSVLPRNTLQRYTFKNRRPPAERDELSPKFKSMCSLMFSGDGAVPRNLRPISILVDGNEGCVVSFDARQQRGL